MLSLPVSRSVGDQAFIDRIELEDCGLLRVVGWAQTDHEQLISRLSIQVNGIVEPVLQSYWHERLDVPSMSVPPPGICLEYVLGNRVVETLTLHLDGEIQLLSAGGLNVSCAPPHYQYLRSTRRVLHRQHIYGSGPQMQNASSEVIRLALALRPPVLDFGCGSGSILASLRAAGVEAWGLELDRPTVRAAIPKEMQSFVTLGSGTFPLPFSDRQFESVCCSEVLEHIPHHEDAVAEIARICRSECLITVPDSASIALLHKHGVVPWHLLEASHVNFFTQLSLEGLLGRYFRTISVGRLGAGAINGTPYWTSLAAWCSEPLTA